MGGRMKGLPWLGLVLAMMLGTGCGLRTAEVQQRPGAGIDNAYLGVLDTLTVMMKDSRQEPSRQLETIRSWVSDNHDEISHTIEKFHQDVLAMSPEEREVWRVQAQPELEKRLDNYAKAQLSFQKRLNATQKWELGEILSQLQ